MSAGDLGERLPRITARSLWGHLRTITRHKMLVLRHCFSVGLYWQGLVHDLSKYGPTEFLAGARFFQGDRSPNTAERAFRGYSTAWLHHKGRNRHHFEYWIDMKGNGDASLVGMEMPVRYVVEMFCDRIAACKTYQRDAYTDGSPLAYYELERTAGPLAIHPSTDALLKEMLVLLAERGERAALRAVREEVVLPDKRARGLRGRTSRSDR